MKDPFMAEFSRLLEFLPDATLVIDTRGVAVAWNRAMEDLTGVAADTILGKGNYEYALPFYGERKPILANLVFMKDRELEQRYNSVVREGEMLVVDIFIPTFGVGGKHLWAKAGPLYDKAGNLIGAIETIRDITERKKVLDEVENTRHRLSQIFAFLPDPTLVIGTDGTLLAWNRAMEELTGVKAESLLGKGDFEYGIPFYGERKPILANLLLLHSDDLEQRYQHVAREGDTIVVDVFIPTFGEKGKFLWAKATPLYDSGGTVIGAIQTIRDITERKKTEERLAKSKAELQIAAEIQRSFLPEEIRPVKGFDIAARSIMAKEVGGDFFDVIPFEMIPLGLGSTGVLIADVSGKGIPAALFMALSRIVIRVNALWYKEPADAITNANNIIAQDSKAGMFVTLFYGVLSEKDRTLTYVNAGHNPPIWYAAQTGTITELNPTGIVIGAAENRNYTSKTIGIQSGDCVVLYTDGITEAINREQEMFGEERLRSVIRSSSGKSAQEIVQDILEAVTAFTEGEPQSDDITLMVIKGM